MCTRTELLGRISNKQPIELRIEELGLSYISRISTTADHPAKVKYEYFFIHSYNINQIYPLSFISTAKDNIKILHLSPTEHLQTLPKYMTHIINPSII